MEKKLTQYEKYEVSKEGVALNYSFEIIQFIEKLNDNIIKYYQDIVYSYILRKRFDSLNGKTITDERFNEMLDLNIQGLLLFPNIGTNIKNNEYIEQLKREILFVASRIGYNNQYSNILNFASKGDLGLYLKYEECIDCAKELKEFENNNIKEYINRIVEQSKDKNFNFKYQLNDFIDRLQAFYMSNKDEEKYNNIKVLRKHMNSKK